MTKNKINTIYNQLLKSLELCQVGNWNYNIKTKEFNCSNLSYKIFGLENTKTETLLLNCINTIHPDDINRVSEEYALSLIEKKEFYIIEHRVIDEKTSNIRFVQEKFSHLRDSVGQVVESYGIIQDITDNKFTEKRTATLAAAVEQSVNSIVITDLDGNIEYTNPKFTELSGYKAEEVVGKNPNILNAGTQPNSFYDDLWASISKGKTWKGEFHNKKKNGDLYWENVIIKPIKNDSGETINYLAIKEDITALKESEQRLKLLINTSPDIIFFKDGKGKWIEVNESVKECLDLKSDDYKRKTNYDLANESDFHKATLLHCAKTDEIAWQNKKMSSFEETVIKKDGSNSTYDIIKIPVFNEDMTRKSLVIIGRDITKRKKAEDALKASEGKYRKIFEHAPIGIITINENGYPTNMNQHVLDILGSPSFEASKKINVLTFPNLIDSGFTQSFKECLKTRRIIKSENSYTSIWGKHIYVKCIFTPIIDDHNRLGGVQALLEDITTQTKTQRNLIIAKEKAEESDRLKTAFLANISHEIRTPMNGIVGFLGLLKDPNLTPEEVREYSEVIEMSSDRMLNTINDIIEVSKIEAKKTRVNISNVEINELFDKLYRSFKPEAKKAGLDLSYTQSKSPSVNIPIDKSKLYVIITNLLNNAIKYTKKGQIKFGFERNNGYLNCFVQDTGIGIAKDKQKSIFNAFIKENMTISSYYEGNGLGLTIAKSYVDLLGGKMWIKSMKGKGSKFYFSVPFAVNHKVNKLLREVHSA